jgi:NADH dehydrogenase
MILLVGGTGELGSRIAERLRARGTPFRALVRPATDASKLEALDAEIVRGDLREAESLRSASEGVRTVITTVTAVSRVLRGEKTSIRDVDELGNANLVAAAEESGAERFVFLSFVITPGMAGVPLAEAKRATEERLSRSRIREVVVRPDLFQEIWLSKLVQFDWANGKVLIFGKGEAPHGYIALADVAEAAVRLALHENPPVELAIGGPEALTRKQIVERFESAMGRQIKRRHVPRLVLRAGSVALRRVQPVRASLMGMALDADEHPQPLSPEPLRDLGIDPRPVGIYIDELVRSH